MKKHHFLLSALLCLLGLITANAQFNDILNFSGTTGTTQGAYPYGALTWYGSKFYGMAQQGGSGITSNGYGGGVVFSVNKDGSGYTVIHNFTTATSDGINPVGNITPTGAYLVGMTQVGGQNNTGLVFRIDTVNDSFQDICDFPTITSSTVGIPVGNSSLLVIGNVIYGMETMGGANSEGLIFSLTPNFSGPNIIGYTYHDLYNFNGYSGTNPSGSKSDGAFPIGSFINNGSILYGMTYEGGSIAHGIIFSYNTANNSFTDLHNFTGYNEYGGNSFSDGALPYGDLNLQGNVLYGMTSQGGSGAYGNDFGGMIFSMNTDGTSFTDLHDFGVSGNDGAYPEGSLLVNGNIMYGTTLGGPGGLPDGIIFSINTNGSSYTVMHNFQGGSRDGYSPQYSKLTQIGNELYGMTEEGGPKAFGIIFSYSSCNVSTTANVTSNVLCNGASNGNASATPGGGVTPYTYSWVNSSSALVSTSNPTGSILSAGAYTVTAIDNNGCSATASVNITQPLLLGVNIPISTNVNCYGYATGSLSAFATNGTSPYTYSWSNGTSLSSATGLTAGSYSVSVRDASGCSAYTTGTITQPAQLQLLGLVGGDSVVFSYSASFQNWTVPAGNSLIEIAAAGASGGSGAAGTGGNGANISGYCNVVPGHTLDIVTGGVGNANSSFAGGGGGSFVWDAPSTGLLVAAAGGGGGANGTSGGNGGTDLIGNSTTNNSFSGSNSAGGSGGNGGAGGTGSSQYGSGGGGAGWLSNGGNGFGTNFSYGGNDRVNGFTGGASTYGAQGGFGGGGGGAWGQGGGGGYNGGGAGDDPGGYYSGGGGGSYLNGTVSGTPVANNTGNGYVTIYYSVPVSNPVVNQNVSCYNGTDGIISVPSVAGGTSPYTYLWSPGGATTSLVTGLTAGTYSVTVKDANGCSVSGSAVITQPTPVSISISTSVNINCNPGAGSATANPATGGTSPYSYNWTPSGGTNLSAPGLSAGSYTITATDSKGCTGSASVNITEPDILTITYTTTPILCNGGNSTVTINASGGTPSYSGTGIFTNTAGTYNYVVTDFNGCSATASVTITQPALLTATCSSAAILCYGDITGSAMVSVSGGLSPYTYLWSNGSKATSISGLSAGIYTLNVTDNSGCNATASATITQPASALAISIASQTNLSCNGSNNGAILANAATGGTPFPSAQTITTYAGDNISGYSGDGGLATNAELFGPYNVAVDGSGNVYIADALNNVIREVNHSTGYISTVAGNSTSGYSGDGAAATLASLSVPTAVAVDGSGNIFIADNSNYVIREVNYANGIITTVAGNGAHKYSGDGGPATSASFDSPAFLTIDGAGNIFITDNSDGVVREVNHATGIINTVAGNQSISGNYSGDGGSATSAALNNPIGVAVDGSDNLFIADDGNNVIREVNYSTGIINTVAGNNNRGYSGDGGVATNAMLNSPAGISVDGSDNIFFSDFGNNVIREVNHASGIISTVAGNYSKGGTYSGDGSAATSAGLNSPIGIATDGSDDIFISDFGNNVIRKVSAASNSPYNYVWTPTGGTTLNASGLSAGTYTISVTDANGCTTSASTTITQPAILNASALVLTNVRCNGGNNGSAQSSVSGGTSPYTYSWSTGATTSGINGLSVGAYTLSVVDADNCSNTASVVITQPATLSASASVLNNVSCNGGNNGSAQSLAGSGTSPYTYSWSNGATTANATGLTAGSYTVTITDNCGAPAKASVSITQPAVLTSSAYVTNVSCFGGNNGAAISLQSGGTLPYTYSWSNGASTANINNLTAGNYSLKVTDNNGCTSTNSVMIDQPNVLNPNASVVNISCSGGNNGSASSSPAGGVTPYTYSWSNGAVSSSISSLTASAYTITITDNNGCTASALANVTQPNALAAPITFTGVLCNGGNTGSASASVSGGTSPYSYHWSNSTTKSSISGLSAGTYTLLVTDSHSCSTTSSTTITQPTVISSSITVVDISSCGTNNGSASVSVSGGTSPYTYKWGSNAGSKTTSSVSGLSKGTYTILVTDAHSCTSTATCSIVKAANLTATLSAVDILCLGSGTGSESVVAAGGISPYTYSWSNGNTTTSISGLSAGTYSITVYDAAGCTASASKAVTQPAKSLTATISTITEVTCNGSNTGSIKGSASGGTSPYTYSWNNSQTNATATGLSAGTYTLYVTDHNGCTSIELGSVTQPAVLSIATTQTNVTTHNGTNGKATASASGGKNPYNYSWSNSKTTAAITGLSAGTYTITVTDKNGCTATNHVTITQPPAANAPEKHNTDDTTIACCPGLENINLYPNPNSGQFNISGLVNGMMIEIYDYSGRKISNITASDVTMQFNLSNQAAGVYLVRIISKEGKLISQKKVVKTE